ncbi:hypothetical protein HUN08_04470 [Gordonia sp. X0973]|uniref:hypothetical protein n=1 Tax=Gordonia sp. X0973 TaxID=2742602 RepID=UPI000F52C6A6|nr:hypothetical protein [Gordonia sp. X0973]QKT06525.1 hypothetical protein HUN08_04470 [Gordonia sp. X0973]
MLPSEIRKWDTDEVERVFGLCDASARTCQWFGQPLDNPQVFESWSGNAAGAASRAGRGHRKDLDDHGNELARVGAVAKRAATEIADLKARLDRLQRSIDGDGMVLDESSGTVTDPRANSLGDELGSTDAGLNASNRAAIRDNYQREVNTLMQDADQADRDLAVAIEGATGQIPVDSVKPSVGGTPAENRLPGFPGSAFESSKLYPTSSPSETGVRYVPMTLPKGWHDDASNPQTDLGRKYSKTVNFSRTDKGIYGRWVDVFAQNQGEFSDQHFSVFNPKDPKSNTIDFSVNRYARFRVDSATPTKMESVTMYGQQYMRVEYKYNYSLEQSTVAEVNGIKFPIQAEHHMDPDQTAFFKARYGAGTPLPGA